MTSSMTARLVGPDAGIIGLVGTAHFSSHFFQLALPPLFPVLKEAFGVGYTELGLMMTLFYAASGVSQTVAGFVVDRIGAHKVLSAGILLLAGSIAMFGLVPSFWLALPLVALAGIGNSVFHPADCAILTHAVAPARMGRAYGIHTLGGTLGWAAAPVTILALSAAFGWRGALTTVGLAGILVGAMIAMQKRTLDVAPRQADREERAGSGNSIRLLVSPPVFGCFAYFALLAVSLTGLQTFLPAALPKLQAIDLATASLALTFYLVANAGGTLAGGVLADRTHGHERIIAFGLAGAATMILLVAHSAMDTILIFAALSLAGFFSGATTPSRDMLVRAATPRGSAGKVFGFVYSGLDLGACLAPLIIGVLLDGGQPKAAMNTIAASLALTIATAFLLRNRTPGERLGRKALKGS